MNVKEAVDTALTYVADLFEKEKPRNVGLEEVEFKDAEGQWHVTVGFSRPWDYGPTIAGFQVKPRRDYKVVRIDDESGKVLSVKIRKIDE